MSRVFSILTTIVLILEGAIVAIGQESGDIRELKLKDWQPQSMMITRVTQVNYAKYPVIDVHNHLGDGRGVDRYLCEMDAAGVYCVVNLDGGTTPERVKEVIGRLEGAHPGRFLTFALVDFRGLDEPGWGERAARQLEECFLAGAKGLKIHKNLGLGIRHKDGRLLEVDDPVLDPVWETCAKHGRPVVIHSADPAAFFTPLDAKNERWHELNANPGWLFYGERWPSRNAILEARNRMIARHPKTTFICAHLANNPEDLETVGRWLDAYPNMVCDIDARISELGRQPYTARRFFIKYQDRVMFGTDTTPVDREAYRIYYRFLETEDEYFDCRKSHHLQGFWMIYGVNLPDKVLRKIYYQNALKYLYGLAEYKRELERFQASPAVQRVVVGRTAPVVPEK
ncbi:amidohydrolase [bacterium]|nr:amidohydrolase [bacterium]